MKKTAIDTKCTLEVGTQHYRYFSLRAAASQLQVELNHLPFSIKILAENLLRFIDTPEVKPADVHALLQWQPQGERREIAWRPARILMQDFTGVPAIVDLAAMRDAVAQNGGDPALINPQIPVDLVIDHSVSVQRYASSDAYAENVTLEMQQNYERYKFLRWGQSAFSNFRVVPPGTGICHQVNLEYLAEVVHCQQTGSEQQLYCDSVVGTDSHTTMINGLAVLGWGVGGIEAEAAMLGAPISMLVPDVVGVYLHDQLKPGITATDLVLTITNKLRTKGVVGKFVEFCGPGLNQLALADRATIANMTPEYGATCTFFPVDSQTINYLRLTGRSAEHITLVEAFAKAQGLWRDDFAPLPEFSSVIDIDLNQITPSVAGPKRPQDLVPLAATKTVFRQVLTSDQPAVDLNTEAQIEGENFSLHHGDVVIAAITSCTNTSNPSVMLAAGLLAQKAVQLGLQCKPWVKTSLAPGSKVVSAYLDKTGLQQPLDQLGFNLVGYGCTTCIGNSGPLDPPIAAAIDSGELNVCAVLSGNRNFEGRIHPQVKSSWLASPPLVVAYALAGTMCIDLLHDPIGTTEAGKKIYLKDIWPSNAEIASAAAQVQPELFTQQYADLFRGDEHWQQLPLTPSQLYPWDEESTYIRKPPFFTQPVEHQDIVNARILALLGDSITTDHISPAGVIATDSPAGEYLAAHGVARADFNSYGSRRGNHEVMMRGTFANIRLRNEMVAGVVGGVTRYIPGDEIMPIFNAAEKYQQQGVALVIIAGKEYGTGSSRDWAAKGTLLQGVKAVIAQSFERIHRSNLLGMGILPLQFMGEDSRTSLHLTGDETITLRGLGAELSPACTITMSIKSETGAQQSILLKCRLDTADELRSYLSGGILRYVLDNMKN
ncbi:MAG: aconitate hydratase AcnA [Desulfuromonas sp.]|nr:aconitate hydratase AcnA [Desulfuromonas sp.]